MKNIGLLFLCVLTLCACHKKICTGWEKRDLVISELMPWNITGLQSPEGNPVDWIEIKNISHDTIDVEGMILAVSKLTTNKKDSLTREKKCILPSYRIPPGEFLIVFSDKNNNPVPSLNQSHLMLGTDFKLPKEGATVRLMEPGDNVVSEVTYSSMEPDCSLELKPDSTYDITLWPTPGFENSIAGGEASIEYIEKSRPGPILIWELFSRGKKSTDNWVELKNISDSVIDLAEYSLSRKYPDESAWQLPSKKLQPGQLIVFNLAGKKANPFNSSHSKIKLGKHETLVLLRKGKVADAVNARSTIQGGSIGRKNGENGFFYFDKPSRGVENNQKGYRRVAPLPSFDPSPGVFAEQDSVILKLLNSDRKIRFTVDGSKPATNSPLFKDSLILNKNIILRAFDEGDSLNLHSDVRTCSYFLREHHNLPIINITVNNSDLYDYNYGIYADGPGYSPEWPHYGANFWQNWTKNAHVEFFEPGKKGFSLDCGIKIFGGFSRYEAKKSFQLKFSGYYGSPRLTYDFFNIGHEIELEDVVLRSGAQDYNRCMLRDEFFTSLISERSPSLLTQLYRPVALYINAEYFGLYYIREKIDKHFVSRKLNLPTDSIDIIVATGLVEEGSGKAYNKIMKFLVSNDMSKKENFEYASKHIDLQGLIDHKLGEIYSGNTDVGNVRYVLSSDKKSDRKWRFVFYDLDATWTSNNPGVGYYLGSLSDADENTVAYHNRMIASLLKNKQFRNMFLQRLSYHLTNTFSAENAALVFDKLVDQIRPEMYRNCERWPQLSYKQWEKNVSVFRERFKTRPQEILNDIRRYLKVTDQENNEYFSHLGY